MIKFLRGMFGGKASSGQDTGSTDAPLLKEATPAVVWRAKDDPENPFDANGYDCLAFARSMLSTTADPAVATSYSAQRASDGRDRVGLFPPDAVALDCRLVYALAEAIAEGPVFKASHLEEKWDLYLYGGRLYFCRSWTGALVFVADCTVADTELTITQIIASSSGTGMDYRYAVRQVDYLLRSHWLQQAIPHPLPAGMDRDPKAVGLFSFSQYGWRCCFGTFEETLRRDIVKPQGAVAASDPTAADQTAAE